ncbi:MAG: alginate export family protein [Planctomycetota bacterium]
MAAPQTGGVATVTSGQEIWNSNALAGKSRLDVQSVEILFDLRVRYAAWHNADQNNSIGGQYNDDFLQRTRLGAWFKINEHVNALISMQDWRRWGENTTDAAAVTADNLNTFGTDVRQAWVEFVDLFHTQHFRFDTKIGRQTFATGAHRLISNEDWSQTGNLFDGITGLMDAIDGSWNARLFYFRLERKDGSVATVDQKLRQFFGVHITLDQKAADKTGGRIDLFQPYLYILKRDGQDGVEPRGIFLITYGFLTGGDPSPNFNWQFEGALQGGKFYTSYVQAFMASFVGSWTLHGRNGYSPIVSLLLDWASGDNNPNDKAVHTFNPLFGEQHDTLGEMDAVGRANERSIALRALFPLPGMDNVNAGQTFKRSVFVATLSQFWVDNTHDNWYGSGVGADSLVTATPFSYGGVRVPLHNPNAPSELGTELDLRMNSRMFNAVDVSFVFGHFWAEGFGDKTGVPATPRTNGDFDTAYLQFELFGGAE